MNYVYAVLGWVLWCSLHSALISITVTEYLKRKLGDGFRYYRLFFNIFSLGTVVPLFYYSASIRGETIFSWEGPLAVVPYLLKAAGISLFIAGGRNYSLSQLLGIHPILARKENPSDSDTFVVSGIHKMTRHPWYLGGILLVWAEDLSLSTILVNLVITFYFVIGTLLEERKLAREFGEPYREYQKNVSMLFPGKWLKTQMTWALHFPASRPGGNAVARTAEIVIEENKK